MTRGKNQATPNNGVVLRCGDECVVTSRYELHKYGIATRRSGREVVLDGAVKTVYEKKNWDYCRPVNRLFADKRAAGKVASLAPILVEEVIVQDSCGMHTLYPQWNNCW